MVSAANRARHGVIRPAVETDVPELVAMIRELAEFEHLADQVEITEDDLAARCSARTRSCTTGSSRTATAAWPRHALWFRTFSTFLGKTGIWSRTSTSARLTAARATPAPC